MFLYNKFSGLSDAKVKEGIFVGPDIKKKSIIVPLYPL